jgi:hypothetical protein
MNIPVDPLRVYPENGRASTLRTEQQGLYPAENGRGPDEGIPVRCVYVYIHILLYEIAITRLGYTATGGRAARRERARPERCFVFA